MNVCLISREFPPFFGGGIGTYTVQWSRALAAAGHRVVVVTISDDGAERQEEADGVTVVRLPFIRGQEWTGPHPAIASPAAVAAFGAFSPVSVFAMQIEAAMPRIVRTFSIDIIEAPDTGALAWFGLNNRRTGGSWRDLPPVVTTIHSPTAWIAEQNRAHPDGRRERALIQMEAESAAWSDGLVCPSAYLAEWSERAWGLPKDSIKVVPYALGSLEGVARTSICERLIRRSPDGRFAMMYAGRLEPRKSVDTLLAGFASAATALPGLTLDLVGEDMPDPDAPGLFGQNSLQRLVPENLRSRVRLHGRKTPEEVAALRAASDAVVIPSSADNFPFACVEAMAEGRLVIGSSGGGIGEMMGRGEGGVVFDAGDPESLAEAIIQTAARSPQDLTKAARGAASRAIAVCGNRGIVPKRMEHYETVLGRERTWREWTGDMVVVNPVPDCESAVLRLEAALRANGDIDFAHGWPRAADGTVHAHATPELMSLSLASRMLGPLIMKAEHARDPRVSPLLQSAGAAHTNGAIGGVHTDSTWVLALALCAAGYRGAVVPEAAADVPMTEHHPAERSLFRKLSDTEESLASTEFELRKIYGSRGWKTLQRVYGVLHVLKGRTFTRPTYDEGERAKGP